MQTVFNAAVADFPPWIQASKQLLPACRDFTFPVISQFDRFRHDFAQNGVVGFHDFSNRSRRLGFSFFVFRLASLLDWFFKLITSTPRCRVSGNKRVSAIGIFIISVLRG